MYPCHFKLVCSTARNTVCIFTCLPRSCEHFRQAAVPAFDAEHLVAAGRAFVGELLTESKQRQIFGIGEKKSAKTSCHLAR